MATCKHNEMRCHPHQDGRTPANLIHSPTPGHDKLHPCTITDQRKTSTLKKRPTHCPTCKKKITPAQFRQRPHPNRKSSELGKAFSIDETLRGARHAAARVLLDAIRCAIHHVSVMRHIVINPNNVEKHENFILTECQTKPANPQTSEASKCLPSFFFFLQSRRVKMNCRCVQT